MMFATKLKFFFLVLNFILLGYLMNSKINASGICDNIMEMIREEIKNNNFPVKGSISISDNYINVEPTKEVNQNRQILTEAIASYFKTKFPSKSIVFSVAPYNIGSKSPITIQISKYSK